MSEITPEQLDHIIAARVCVNAGGWSDGGLMGVFEGIASNAKYPVLCFPATSEAMPTDEELMLLRQITEKLMDKVFRPEYIAKVMAEPLPLVEGYYNTTLVRKMVDQRQKPGRVYWQHRKSSWTQGPSWQPYKDADEWIYLSLEELAHDHILRPIGGWKDSEE